MLTWYTAATIGLAVVYLVSLIGLVQTVPTPLIGGDWTPAIASVLGAGSTTVALTVLGFVAAVRATQ
jgi:hypothetical protein